MNKFSSFISHQQSLHWENHRCRINGRNPKILRGRGDNGMNS